MNQLMYGGQKSLVFLMAILTGLATEVSAGGESIKQASLSPEVVSSNAPLQSNSAVNGGPKVAIVASAGSNLLDVQFTEPRDRLLNSGMFASVDVYDAAAATPSLNQLLTYDAVIVWSNYNYSNSIILGYILADYVDAGGGVVIAPFENTDTHPARSLKGRWLTGQYYMFPPAGGQIEGPESLGTIYLPGHPLISGVTSFHGGSSSFRPTSAALVDSAQRVADWTDGTPLVLFRDDTIGARVDLTFFPPSDVVMANYWDAGTDGAQLLVNALLYAANRPPLIPGDSDNDGDVDEVDYARFETCFGESAGGARTAKCVTFDFNDDDLVDCDDWMLLSKAWTAAGTPPNTLACVAEVPTVSEWGLFALVLCLLTVGSCVFRHTW